MDDSGIRASAEQEVILAAARLAYDHHIAESKRKDEEQILRWAEVIVGWPWHRHPRGIEAARKIVPDYGWSRSGYRDRRLAERAEAIIYTVSARGLSNIVLPEEDIRLLRDHLGGVTE